MSLHFLGEQREEWVFDRRAFILNKYSGSIKLFGIVRAHCALGFWGIVCDDRKISQPCTIWVLAEYLYIKTIFSKKLLEELCVYV